MCGSPAVAAIASLHSFSSIGDALAAERKTAGRSSRSPGVHNAWTPGTDRTNRMLRSRTSSLTYGSYQVSDVWVRSPQGRAAALDGHYADVPNLSFFEQLLRRAAVGGIGPQTRVDGEHDGVEVVTAQRLEVRLWRRQIVASYPDEPAESLVART